MRLKKLVFAAMMAVMLVAPVRVVVAQESAKPVASQSVGEKSEPGAQEPKEEEESNDAFLKSPSVIKFGSMLGLKPENAALVFQIVNFAVLAIAVLYALVKSLPSLFRKRTATIGKQITDARVATEDANKRMAAVEERLSKLDSEIASLKTQAEKDAAAEDERLKHQLEEEKQKIVAAAEQEIAAASAHAQRQIREYAAELAISQAATKLQITAETDRLLIRSFAERLGGANGGQN